MKDTQENMWKTDGSGNTAVGTGLYENDKMQENKETKGATDNLIREAAPKYGAAYKLLGMSPEGWDRQGEYTLEDYYALPGDLRVELIGGVFYVMNAPSVRHQVIADEIRGVFSAHIRKNKGSCLAVTSPVDVQLDQDDKTMVEPDVIIVCDRQKLKRGIVFGAPDLVVEILSKSTRNRDLFLKLNKYHDAGVREYWVVDPDLKTITVYRFDGEVRIETYGAAAKIPVGIFSDACVVDFGEIFAYTEFLEGTGQEML